MIAHEQTLTQLDIEDSKQKKEKTIALKANSSDDSEDESTSDDEDIARLTRNFNKFLQRKKRNFNLRRGKKDFKNSPKTNEPMCYECRKPGHIKPDCPNLKNNKKEKEDSRRHNRRMNQNSFWIDHCE